MTDSRLKELIDIAILHAAKLDTRISASIKPDELDIYNGILDIYEGNAKYYYHLEMDSSRIINNIEDMQEHLRKNNEAIRLCREFMSGKMTMKDIQYAINLRKDKMVEDSIGDYADFLDPDTIKH